MNIFKLSIFVFVFVSLITVPGFVLATNDTEIVWFSAKDPNPTTHSVLLGWGAKGITRTDHVDLEVICDSGSIKFSTNYNNNPTCEKGGVWSWTGVNTGSITVTPAGNTKPVTVRFHLMIWSGDGTLLGEMNESVTFPATADCSNCVIDGGGYVAPDKISVDYQSIIKNLLEQIRVLQMKLDEKDKDYDQKFAGVVVEPSLPTPPDCYAYASQSLRVGDRSLAVTNVYNLMVKEGLISENQQDGFWSDGTTLFGERLASAVTKFQEKYSNDILKPNQLDRGNGYVGNSTRAKLNALYGCKSGITKNDIQGTDQSSGSVLVNNYQNTDSEEPQLLEDRKVGQIQLFNTRESYTPGQTIRFAVKGITSAGGVASPIDGFHVQSAMDYIDRDLQGHGNVIVDGVYQSFNGQYNERTKMWDVVMTAPNANVSPAGYSIEAVFYCSDSQQGCGQISKSFKFFVRD